jgi:hypothetical protein
MNARTGLSLFGILLTTALAACGGGGSKTLTADDFCSMKADAECQVAPTCVVPMADCTTKRKMVCQSFVAGIKDPRVFVPANVGVCISKAQAVYKQQLIKPADMAALDDVCNYVFQGAVAALDACTTKYDCKDKSNICDKGHCAPQMVKGNNAQCSDFGAVCGSTQYCKMVAAATMCVDKGGANDPCDPLNPCDDTKMFRCLAGTCAMQVAAGEACTTNADCLPAAPYCNPYAGGKCSPGLTFSAGAASCNDFGGTGSTTGVGGAGGAAGGGAGAGGAGGAAGGADGGGSAGSDGGTTG